MRNHWLNLKRSPKGTASINKIVAQKEEELRIKMRNDKNTKNLLLLICVAIRSLQKVSLPLMWRRKEFIDKLSLLDDTTTDSENNTR